jgi:hypothetical protein
MVTKVRHEGKRFKITSTISEEGYILARDNNIGWNVALEHGVRELIKIQKQEVFTPDNITKLKKDNESLKRRLNKIIEEYWKLKEKIENNEGIKNGLL